MLALDQNHCSPNEGIFYLWSHNYYTDAGISQTFNMLLTVVSKKSGPVEHNFYIKS